MSTTFTAQPTQQPEMFALNWGHMESHPVYADFHILRNGNLWLDVSSASLGMLGRFDLRQFPPDQWIALQDGQGQPFPVEVLVQRFGGVLGRWLSTNPSAPAAPAAPAPSPPPPSPAAGPLGLDLDALFQLSQKPRTSVPPELQATVEDFADFVGCTLGMVLSERQLEQLRTAAMQALSQGESDDAKFIQAAAAAFRPVKSADAQARNAWREQEQAKTVWMLVQHHNDGTLCAMLEQWCETARQQLAAGDPPLTREAAESFVELAAFAATIAQRKDPSIESASNLEATIAQLTHDYPNLSLPQQRWIVFSPIALYELRRSWPGLSPPQREDIRVKLARQFNIPLTEMPDASRIPLTETPDASRAPTGGVPTGMAPPAAPAHDWERFRGNETNIASLQRQWSEAKARGDEEAAVKLQLDIQKALQGQKEQAAMLTNMASILSSMHMKTADNLKA